mgnify:CR=1 FL=1
MCCSKPDCAFATLDGPEVMITDYFVVIQKRDGTGFLIISKYHASDIGRLWALELVDLQCLLIQMVVYLDGDSHRMHFNFGPPLQSVDHFHIHLTTVEELLSWRALWRQFKLVVKYQWSKHFS